MAVDRHHLRALRTAGLAGSRRDAKVVFYKLTPAGQDLITAHLAAGAMTR